METSALLCIPHCTALCIVQSMHCGLFIVYCVLCTIPSTALHPTLHCGFVQCKALFIYCTALCIALCTALLCIPHCTGQYAVQCTVYYAVHYVLCIALCIVQCAVLHPTLNCNALFCALRIAMYCALCCVHPPLHCNAPFNLLH